MLALLLRIDHAEAKARVGAVRDVASRRTSSGEQLEPALPHVAMALREGEIHPRHASIIARAIDGLHPAVDRALLARP